MLSYPARIKHNKKENAYEVSFPDVKGCYTYGETIEEAKNYAKEALTGCLDSSFERNIEIPVPSKLKGDDIYYISPELSVAFAIILRRERERRKLSQIQVAGELEISYQAYQRFENPRKSNPTLKTISKIENVLGINLIQI